MLLFSRRTELFALFLILHLTKANVLHSDDETNINIISTTTDVPIITSTENEYSTSISTTPFASATSKVIRELNSNSIVINKSTNVRLSLDTTTMIDMDYVTTTKANYEPINGNEVLWSTSEANDNDLQTTTTKNLETTSDEILFSSTSTLVPVETETSMSQLHSPSTNFTPLPSEKKGKVMKDNTNISNLTLPDNADVWTLVGMKENPVKAESKLINNSISNIESESMENKEEEAVGTKNLSDWSKIMKEVSVFNETNRVTATNTNSVETEPYHTISKTLNSSTQTQESFVKSDDELQTVLFKPPDKYSDQIQTTTTKYQLLTTVEYKTTTSYKITESIQHSKTVENNQTTELNYAAFTETPEILEINQSSTKNSGILEANKQVTFVTAKENNELSTVSVTNFTELKLNNIYTSYTDEEATTNLNLFLYEVGNISKVNTIPYSKSDPNTSNTNTIVAISISLVCALLVVIALGFIYIMRKRQKQTSYGQRCRPVGLDAYSLDNVSVCNSMRRKGNSILRQSQRIYGNAAFDDPSLKHNVLRAQDLKKFSERKSFIYDEFKDVPQIIARSDEVPHGCEELNRYANVIPLPETRVLLEKQGENVKTEYINANYVRGPKDSAKYYIATQGPLESTIVDFWRMVWEQNSNVIIMATDLVENGIEKCAEYLPYSVTLDNHTIHGDFQITLKDREVKEKYAVSKVQVTNIKIGSSRNVYHFWYSWPEVGVPSDEKSVIDMLSEARLKTKIDSESNDKTSVNKSQCPIIFHCSNGTGRTGSLIACDIAIRCLNEPKRSVDIPQIVYCVRRGRASSIQTKEQYEFIYKVATTYANRITALNE